MLEVSVRGVKFPECRNRVSIPIKIDRVIISINFLERDLEKPRQSCLTLNGRMWIALVPSSMKRMPLGVESLLIFGVLRTEPKWLWNREVICGVMDRRATLSRVNHLSKRTIGVLLFGH